jgi:hypothetical protein
MTQPAAPNDEERLGKRRSFWARMRNRVGFFGKPKDPTKHANEDLRAIGLQGDNPARTVGPFGR